LYKNKAEQELLHQQKSGNTHLKTNTVLNAEKIGNCQMVQDTPDYLFDPGQ
jgi:hypothetical protein